MKIKFKKELSKDQEFFMVALKESNPHIHSIPSRITNISPQKGHKEISARGKDHTEEKIILAKQKSVNNNSTSTQKLNRRI